MVCTKPEKLTLCRSIVRTAEFAGVLVWLSNLRSTDAYYSVYVLCGLCAVMAMAYNWHSDFIPGKKVRWSAAVLSILFSLAVAAANYPIFQQTRDPAIVSVGANRLMNYVECLAVILSGIPIAYHCLRFLYVWFTASREGTSKRASGKHPMRFYFAVFGFITLIDLVYLFFVNYPGSVSGDSMAQITQTYTGKYNNFLPYWYTRFIGLVLSIGYSILGDPNKAVAFYSFVQILMMAAVFAYVVLTLYQRKSTWLPIVLAIAVYGCMPYNIAFSASMWKDVLFTGAILLLVTAEYRILNELGSQKLNYLNLLLGGFGTCLMRTNGWYVMLVSLIILLFCGSFIRKKLAIALAVIVAFGFFMNEPMLKLQNVSGIVKTETISLPLQQMARVIVRDRELSELDEELLSKLMNPDTVNATYKEWTSDPVKNCVNGEELFSHVFRYLSLWLRLGAQYPQDYFEAWVELTKGYWNGGYDYYIYAEYIKPNDYGIFSDPGTNIIKELVKPYFAFSRESFIFEPLLSIGLHVWMLIMLLWFSLLHKKRESIVFIPLLVILAGLWVGTPVFSEFRYAYPVVAAVPLLAPSSLDLKE